MTAGASVISPMDAATGKSAPKNLVTLEILYSLLHSQGLRDSAECLQREAGFNPPECSSPGGEGDARAPAEIVAPATEEALRLRAHAASLAQAEQRRRISSLVQEMQKKETQMAEIRALMTRVRAASVSIQRPSLEEQEEIMRNNGLELKELEALRAEQDLLGKRLRAGLDRTIEEVTALRLRLGEREDEETKARIQLTRMEEEVLKLTSEIEGPPFMSQARKIQTLLSVWHNQDEQFHLTIRSLFQDMDRDRDGRLEWNNNEIRGFVIELFRRNNIHVPTWGDPVWYDMYRKADVDGSYSLELEEATRFAKSCFEAALAMVLTGQADNGESALVLADHWVKSHSAPNARSVMTYNSGVIIDFLDFSSHFGPLISANNAHRAKMVRIIETGEHVKATMKTYRDCDKDGNGRLTWNNGEIRDFIAACFLQHGLNPPSEQQIFAMYNKFDKDKNQYLDMRECLELVDAIFRSTFLAEHIEKPRVIQTAPVRLRGTSPIVTDGSGNAIVRNVSPRRLGTAPIDASFSNMSGSFGTAPGGVEVIRTATSPGSAGKLVVSPRSTLRQAAPTRGLPTVALTQQDLFDKMDANHDGVVTRAELENALQTGVLSESLALTQFPARATSPVQARSHSPPGSQNVVTMPMRSLTNAASANVPTRMQSGSRDREGSPQNTGSPGVATPQNSSAPTLATAQQSSTGAFVLTTPQELVARAMAGSAVATQRVQSPSMSGELQTVVLTNQGARAASPMQIRSQPIEGARAQFVSASAPSLQQGNAGARGASRRIPGSGAMGNRGGPKNFAGLQPVLKR